MKTIMYFHSGSGNKGCEALVKTLKEILQLEEIDLYSFNHGEDYKWGLDLDNINIIRQTDFIDVAKDDVAISIGGDNYCYPGSLPLLDNYNKYIHKQKGKTCLLGCSIDEDTVIKAQDDLKRYDLITARETLTQEALKKIGIEAKVIPDSAFVLPTEDVYFDDMGKEWIGINASNFVSDDMSKQNYKALMDYLMNHTQYNVLLIPHVDQYKNTDYPMLDELYVNNGRIRYAEGSAERIKGYISKCKMVATARTHVSIASYSLCIPTLVLGYSIKSKGIALDLFGTDNGYVIPKEDLTSPDELKNGFKWLEDNYNDIKQHLEDIMPDYKQRCYKLRGVYESICS